MKTIILAIVSVLNPESYTPKSCVKSHQQSCRMEDAAWKALCEGRPAVIRLERIRVSYRVSGEAFGLQVSQ